MNALLPVAWGFCVHLSSLQAPTDARLCDAPVLPRRLLDNNLSRWEPDPLGVLAAIEARAHGDLPPAA